MDNFYPERRINNIVLCEWLFCDTIDDIYPEMSTDNMVLCESFFSQANAKHN